MLPDPTLIRTRRSLLAGGMGALIAAAATAIGRPLPAAAGGQSLVMGTTNTSDASSTTVARQDGKSNASFIGSSFALVGHVFAGSGTAVIGFAQAANATGLAGRTEGNSSQTAILADTTAGNGEGISLHATTHNGIAVLAECTGGAALRAIGLTEFSRSGKASFNAGQSKITITGFRMTSDTLVVATIQGDVAGTWVRGVTVNVPGQSFTIRLNKGAPKTLKVGWFIVN